MKKKWAKEKGIGFIYKDLITKDGVNIEKAKETDNKLLETASKMNGLYKLKELLDDVAKKNNPEVSDVKNYINDGVKKILGNQEDLPQKILGIIEKINKQDEEKKQKLKELLIEHPYLFKRMVKAKADDSDIILALNKLLSANKTIEKNREEICSLWGEDEKKRKGFKMRMHTYEDSIYQEIINVQLSKKELNIQTIKSKEQVVTQYLKKKRHPYADMAMFALTNTLLNLIICLPSIYRTYHHQEGKGWDSFKQSFKNGNAWFFNNTESTQKFRCTLSSDKTEPLIQDEKQVGYF